MKWKKKKKGKEIISRIVDMEKKKRKGKKETNESTNPNHERAIFLEGKIFNEKFPRVGKSIFSEKVFLRTVQLESLDARF